MTLNNIYCKGLIQSLLVSLLPSVDFSLYTSVQAWVFPYSVRTSKNYCKPTDNWHSYCLSPLKTIRNDPLCIWKPQIKNHWTKYNSNNALSTNRYFYLLLPLPTLIKASLFCFTLRGRKQFKQCTDKWMTIGKHNCFEEVNLHMSRKKGKK